MVKQFEKLVILRPSYAVERLRNLRDGCWPLNNAALTSCAVQKLNSGTCKRVHGVAENVNLL